MLIPLMSCIIKLMLNYKLSEMNPLSFFCFWIACAELPIIQDNIFPSPLLSPGLYSAAQRLFWCIHVLLACLLECLAFWENFINSIFLHRAAYGLGSSRQREELAAAAVGWAPHAHVLASASCSHLDLYSLRTVEIYCFSNQFHSQLPVCY